MLTYRQPKNMSEAPLIYQRQLNEAEQKMFLKLDSQTVLDYNEIFSIFDLDGSGCISKEEINRVMIALGESVHDKELVALITSIDYNGDDEINFEEFICLMVKTLTKQDTEEEELITVFKRFDADGDGEIGEEDLVNIMRELGHPFDQEEARDMIFYLNEDDFGTLNFSAFIEAMMYDTQDLELMHIDHRYGLLGKKTFSDHT